MTKYTIRDQIADCIKDIEDNWQTLRQAYRDLEEAHQWVDKVRLWIQRDEDRLLKLKAELYEHER